MNLQGAVQAFIVRVFVFLLLPCTPTHQLQRRAADLNEVKSSMGNCQNTFISPTFTQEPNKARRVSRFPQTPKNRQHSTWSYRRAQLNLPDHNLLFCFFKSQKYTLKANAFLSTFGSWYQNCSPPSSCKNLFIHVLSLSLSLLVLQKRNVSNNQARVLN